MERENQRIMLTKRLLKDSMLRLLEAKELDKISVTELCRDAGINRATFYRHYEIPRDVLLEIEKDMYYDLIRKVELPKTAGDIQPAIEKLCNFLEENADLMRVIIASNSDMEFMMFVNEIYEEIWNELRKLGMLQNLDDKDIRLLTLYCAGGSYFVLRQWLLGKVNMSTKEMASYVYELLNKTDWTAANHQLGFYK